jgi:hypothetical protein
MTKTYEDLAKNVPALRTEVGEADFQTGSELVKTFQWRDRNGRFYWPKDMETRHVFHTIRMIWNNRMPPHMSFADARFYHFGPSYSPEYLKTALIALWYDFEQRTNITPAMKRDIDWMKAWLARGTKDGRQRITDTPKALPKPLWDE